MLLCLFRSLQTRSCSVQMLMRSLLMLRAMRLHLQALMLHSMDTPSLLTTTENRRTGSSGKDQHPTLSTESLNLASTLNLTSLAELNTITTNPQLSRHIDSNQLFLVAPVLRGPLLHRRTESLVTRLSTL